MIWALYPGGEGLYDTSGTFPATFRALYDTSGTLSEGVEVVAARRRLYSRAFSIAARAWDKLNPSILKSFSRAVSP